MKKFIDSVESLNKIKLEAYPKVQMRQTYSGIKISVAMGTCGISAGARDVLNAFIEELSGDHLDSVMVTTIGCQGNCDKEPIVVLTDAEGKETTYAKVTKDMVAEIVDNHVGKGEVVTKYTLENVK